ncbi:MAG: hypothetical protein U0V72_02175 [Cytophagales bacterium]
MEKNEGNEVVIGVDVYSETINGDETIWTREDGLISVVKRRDIQFFTEDDVTINETEESKSTIVDVFKKHFGL